MTTVQDVYADMASRCQYVMVLAREGDVETPESDATQAFGLMVLDDVTGTLLVVEAGIDESGMGSLTLRTFDGSMREVESSIVQAGGSVMITTR